MLTDLNKKHFFEKFHKMAMRPIEFDDHLNPIFCHYTRTDFLSFNDEIGQISKESVNLSLDFAYKMAVGKFHRETRSGGTEKRTPMKIFLDAASGKLGEFAVKNFLINYGDGWTFSEPDISVYKRGVWDKGDGIISKEGSSISLNVAIKSIKHFSNLMLLETKDWKTDLNGAFYIPSSKDIEPEYPDLVILVKIKETPRSIFEYSGEIERENPTQKDLELLKSKTYKYDVCGAITNEELAFLIDNKYIVLRGSVLVSKKMPTFDAENFYAQDKDMDPLIPLLKKIENSSCISV